MVMKLICLINKRWQFTSLFLCCSILYYSCCHIGTGMSFCHIGKKPFRHSAPHLVHSIQPIEIESQSLARDWVPIIPRPIPLHFPPHTSCTVHNSLPRGIAEVSMGDPSLLIKGTFSTSHYYIIKMKMRPLKSPFTPSNFLPRLLTTRISIAPKP